MKAANTTSTIGIFIYDFFIYDGINLIYFAMIDVCFDVRYDFSFPTFPSYFWKTLSYSRVNDADILEFLLRYRRKSLIGIEETANWSERSSERTLIARNTEMRRSCLGNGKNISKKIAVFCKQRKHDFMSKKIINFHRKQTRGGERDFPRRNLNLDERRSQGRRLQTHSSVLATSPTHKDCREGMKIFYGSPRETGPPLTSIYSDYLSPKKSSRTLPMTATTFATITHPELKRLD